jgi:hypothetical protein
MSRKVCVVTGSRAEYGLLRWVMEGIRDSGDLELQVVATGTHLSPEHGLTYREIEEDGFRIDHKVEMLLSADTPSGIVKSTGLAMIGFADVLAQLDPDIVLVLGDRFEILAAATAALISKIPLAHVRSAIQSPRWRTCISLQRRLTGKESSSWGNSRIVYSPSVDWGSMPYKRSNYWNGRGSRTYWNLLSAKEICSSPSTPFRWKPIPWSGKRVSSWRRSVRLTKPA